MKVMCINVVSPRSDHQSGMPSGITLGKVYDVAEVLDDKYSIINDYMKMSRYSQYRFEVVDNSPVLPLRDNFNRLTTCMRTKIKELEAEVRRLQEM